MSLIRLSSIIWLAACLVSGCSETRSVAVSGWVVDLSGAPAAGAQVSAVGDDDRSLTVTSDAQGRFDLMVDRTRSSVVLPASGVYVDPVVLTARTSNATAYSSAPALSISDRAEGPALLILIPTETALSDDACLAAPPRGAYALALANAVQNAPAWLSSLKDTGATEGLHQQARADIGAAARTCALSQAEWRGAYEALDAALDPYRD
jgi:hypothetical protein